jgi:hypothetical protein
MCKQNYTKNLLNNIDIGRLEKFISKHNSSIEKESKRFESIDKQIEWSLKTEKELEKGSAAHRKICKELQKCSCRKHIRKVKKYTIIPKAVADPCNLQICRFCFGYVRANHAHNIWKLRKKYRGKAIYSVNIVPPKLAIDKLMLGNDVTAKTINQMMKNFKRNLQRHPDLQGVRFALGWDVSWNYYGTGSNEGFFQFHLHGIMIAENEEEAGSALRTLCKPNPTNPVSITVQINLINPEIKFSKKRALEVPDHPDYREAKSAHFNTATYSQKTHFQQKGLKYNAKTGKANIKGSNPMQLRENLELYHFITKYMHMSDRLLLIGFKRTNSGGLIWL